VSVLIPARFEAERLEPCLAGLREDPDATEVIVVVDDDDLTPTAAVAEAGGARVVRAAEPPSGWVGKTWALQQGLEAASGRWLVTLDADARPRPGLLRALVAELAEADLVSAGPRLVTRTFGDRLLQPAMLATLPYRFGPPGPAGYEPPPDRVAVNGQCLAFHRERLVAKGGFTRTPTHMTDEIALARSLAAEEGWLVLFLDGADLLDVEMYSSAAETWREWGRSLGMVDVTPPKALAVDLAVIWLAMALPLPRLLLGRGGRIDVALLAVRLGLLAALARSFSPRGPAFWLSPLADTAAAARLTLAALRPSRTWRGRTYPHAPARGTSARSTS